MILSLPHFCWENYLVHMILFLCNPKLLLPVTSPGSVQSHTHWYHASNFLGSMLQRKIFFQKAKRDYVDGRKWNATSDCYAAEQLHLDMRNCRVQGDKSISNNSQIVADFIWRFQSSCRWWQLCNRGRTRNLAVSRIPYYSKSLNSRLLSKLIPSCIFLEWQFITTDWTNDGVKCITHIV